MQGVTCTIPPCVTMNKAALRLGAGALILAAGSASAGRCAPEPRYRPLAETTGKQYGLPAWMLSALVQAESAFCSRAVSATGARGLGQLMPGTARDLGVKNSFDPAQNLDGAARYLRKQYQTFGSWPLALAAYNAGPGAVIQHGGIPPYPETQDYVQKVLGFYTAYSKQAQPPRPTAIRQPVPTSPVVPAPRMSQMSGGAAVNIAAYRPVSPVKTNVSEVRQDATSPTSPAPVAHTSINPPRWLIAPPRTMPAAAPPQQKPEALLTDAPASTGTTLTLRRAQATAAVAENPVTTVYRRGTP